GGENFDGLHDNVGYREKEERIATAHYCGGPRYTVKGLGHVA
nr:hypothetical protein [Tanacetum cinerariifolium]